MSTQVWRRFIYPDISRMGTTTVGNQSLSLGTDAAAVCFAFPRSGDVVSVQWWTRTVTTGCTLDVRVETLDGSNDPSGTLWAANTKGSRVVANSDDNVAMSTALTANATVTAGQNGAIVWRVTSGVPASLQIASHVATNLNNWPAGDKYVAAWVKSTTAPIVTLTYSDGEVVTLQGMPGTGGASLFSIANTDTYSIFGNVFTAPVAMTCTGAVGRLASTDTGIDMVLYDRTAGTVIGSYAVPTPKVAATGFVWGAWEPVNLKKGNLYTIAWRATSATALNVVTTTLPDLDITNHTEFYSQNAQPGTPPTWNNLSTAYTPTLLAITGKALILPNASYPFSG